MYKLIIRQKVLSKARPRFNSRTKIAYKDTNYDNFLKLIGTLWKSQNSKNFYHSGKLYIGFFSLYIPTKGRQPDFLDNQIGGILDSLVATKIIKDDSRSHLFGAKKMSIKGKIDLNIFIIGDENDYRLIDDTINKFYTYANTFGHIPDTLIDVLCKN